MAVADILIRRSLKTAHRDINLGSHTQCLAYIVMISVAVRGMQVGMFDARAEETRVQSEGVPRPEISQVQQVPSYHSGRSTSGTSRMYVLTLDGVPGAHSSNTGRFARMREAWAASCPNDSMVFDVCLGITHPIRGHGVASAMKQCLDLAIRDGVDYAFFLEDDARLEGNATEFCQREIRDSFVRSMPDDALVVLLGAHKQIPSRSMKTCFEETWASPKQLAFRFRPLNRSFGLYVDPLSVGGNGVIMTHTDPSILTCVNNPHTLAD
jgi:hypothetical protein